MTFLKLTDKGVSRFRLAFVVVFLLLSLAWTNGEALAQSKDCNDLDSLDWSAFYAMSPAHAQYQESCAVGLVVQSSFLVGGIHMDILWDSTRLIFERVDFSPWTENFPGDDVDTSYELVDSGNVKLEITAIDGDSIVPYKRVANLWLKLKCFETGDTGWVRYNGRCPDNFIVTSTAELYGPQIVPANVTMDAIVHTLGPVEDTLLVNDTVDMVVQYSSAYFAENGFASYWEYPRDSLDVIGVVKGDLIDSVPQWEADETDDPAELFISYNGSVDSTSSPETIFKIQFKNTMNHNYSQATVKRILDSLRICDHVGSELKSIITDTASAALATFYQTTMKFKKSSARTNTSDAEFPVQLSSNFWVHMVEQENASWFKIDTDAWETGGLITHSGFQNINGWEWVHVEGSADYQFKNDASESDSNINPYGYTRNISMQFVDTGSDTGWQIANILPDTTKLKDLYSGVTIYANGWIYADSGIALVADSFHVTPRIGCPFVYVWDGTQFVEDNTILGSCEITPGQPVTDYYLLSRPLIATPNQYRVQIREFENELSYIDRVKLVAVDHSPNTRIAVTPQGKIFGYDKELMPIACVDHNGRDQLSKVVDRDRNYFVSEEPGYLILTYSRETMRPDNPGEDEPWGTMGPGGPGQPPPQKKAGTVSNLTLEIEDMYGEWREVGSMPPRFYPERSFYILEAENVELADQFRVKLIWDRYYSADELKYYVQSEEKPVKIWRGLLSAVSSEVGDVLEALVDADEEYATLTPGQTIDLAFRLASSSRPGMVRDFVLQTTGYYVSLSRRSVMPSSFALLNNYPNPFNASTMILYNLPQATDVKLEIFNVLGQRIRVLVNEHQSAGYRSVAWDGKDDKGTDVSSGVYFYRLQAENYSDSKKMVLMR